MVEKERKVGEERGGGKRGGGVSKGEGGRGGRGGEGRREGRGEGRGGGGGERGGRGGEGGGEREVPLRESQPRPNLLSRGFLAFVFRRTCAQCCASPTRSEFNSLRPRGLGAAGHHPSSTTEGSTLRN